MLPWSLGKRDINSDIHPSWLVPIMLFLIDSDFTLQFLKMMAVDIRHNITFSIIAAVYVLVSFKVLGQTPGQSDLT